MRGTWNTGLKPFGVPLLVNWTFLLWPLMLWSFGFLKGLQFLIILTVSLLVHEYTHVIAARSVGFMAHDVTVFIFGGAARIPGLLEIKPKYEAYVAIVGPISSFVLAFVIYMISLLMTKPPAILADAVLINVVFAVFNTLPLFPMDGGRVLRAGLSHKLGQEKGTNGAVWTTTILGGVIAAAGLLFSRWNLSVIMVLVIMMAWGERNALRQKMLLERAKDRARKMGYEID